MFLNCYCCYFFSIAFQEAFAYLNATSVPTYLDCHFVCYVCHYVRYKPFTLCIKVVSLMKPSGRFIMPSVYRFRKNIGECLSDEE